jgi:hypothetical protein
MRAKGERPAMKNSTELRAWVDEAIQCLGYIKPEAASKIVKLIQDNESQHPKQISTSYRKEGEPLSGDEKKMLGIRSNAMMSKQALDDLTEKGRAVPLAAHEQTILRASLAWGRAKSISSEKDVGVGKWECLAPFPSECPGCVLAIPANLINDVGGPGALAGLEVKVVFQIVREQPRTST